MIAFEVPDMTCGHCVGTLTKALKAADQGAQVRIDLATHRVDIEPSSSDAAQLAQAIQEAGYTPLRVDAGVGAGAVRAAGACCGHCR